MSRSGEMLLLDPARGRHEADGVIQTMWRYHFTSFPAPELDHIRYVCMVDDRRAREVLSRHWIDTT